MSAACSQFEEIWNRLVNESNTDGLTPEARAHLANCSACREKLAACDSSTLLKLASAGDSQSLGHLEDTSFERLMSALLDKGAEPGDSLCGYRIMKELGRGGMGRVYLAEHPRTGQQVALKVLQAETSSQQYLIRFEAERQALALMEHPNIARVLDSGISEAGQPFFVMELLHGADIVDWCNDHRQTIRQRCELFIQVCQAVQHAHQKGIIHRDLKPSNVLVTEYDGKPVPKVIDFGVAKAVNHDSTVQTQQGIIVGTPQYMSPEQASLSSVIDTRSDVYALGVLLYELLTGETPFRAKGSRDDSLLELLRSIREDNAPAPSSWLADAKVEVAAQRSADAKRLFKQVRGELDWIVLKAIEKEPARRYDSAGTLAEDVRRCLAAEPVQAGPPSRSYRLRKFVQRNRLATAAIAAFVFLLLAATGLSAGLAWWANSERVRAEGAEKDAKQFAAKEQEARGLAEGRLKEVGRANGILLGIFRDINPRGSGAGDDKSLRVTLGERLGHAARRLNERALADPVMATEIFEALGVCQLNLGRHPEAIDLLGRAVAAYTKLFGPDHKDTLTAKNSLATAHHAAAQYTQAIALLEEVLAARLRALDPSHPDVLTTQSNLASTYVAVGRVKDAVALHERTLRERERVFGAKHASTVTSRNNLALALKTAGEAERAKELYRENVEVCNAAYGSKHVYTLMSRNNYAALLGSMGRIADAIPELEAVLAARVEMLGNDHPDTLNTRHTLAEFYREVGRVNESIKLQEETMRLRAAKLGPAHPQTLETKNSLAKSYVAAGQVETGIQLQEACYQSRAATLGSDHPDTLKSASDLGVAYRKAGRLDNAIKLYSVTLEVQRKQLGEDHADTQLSMGNLARAYLDTNRVAEAEQLWRELVASRRRTLPSDHPLLAGSLGRMGEVLLKQKKYSEAEPFLREALMIRVVKEPTVGTTIQNQLALGECLLMLKRFPDAEEHLLNGYEALTKKKANAAVEKLLASTRGHLAHLYEATGKPAEAAKWRAAPEK